MSTKWRLQTMQQEQREDLYNSTENELMQAYNSGNSERLLGIAVELLNELKLEHTKSETLATKQESHS